MFFWAVLPVYHSRRARRQLIVNFWVFVNGRSFVCRRLSGSRFAGTTTGLKLWDLGTVAAEGTDGVLLLLARPGHTIGRKFSNADVVGERGWRSVDTILRRERSGR